VRAGWDGIFSAFVPGVASGYSQQSQVASLYNAVDGNGFLGIGGTTGVETAMITHEWAEAGLVTGDQKYQQATHQNSWLVLVMV